MVFPASDVRTLDVQYFPIGLLTELIGSLRLVFLQLILAYESAEQKLN